MGMACNEMMRDRIGLDEDRIPAEEIGGDERRDGMGWDGMGSDRIG